MSLRPFALDQYAAGSCPVRSQNAYDPRLAAGAAEAEAADPGLVESFREPSTHRQAVIARLLRRFPASCQDLRDAGGTAERIAATRAAVAAGTRVIIGAEPPVDWANHRRGTVDLLLRGERIEGRWMYHPVLIKDHAVLARANHAEGDQLVGTLARPFLHQAERHSCRFRYESRTADLLQLAHFWYLLAAAGWAGPEPWGAIIGARQDNRACQCDVAWVDLSANRLQAYAYTSPQVWRRCSPLSRYRHEHRFRVRVVRRALQQTGTADAHDAPGAHNAGIAPAAPAASVTPAASSTRAARATAAPALVAAPIRVPECETCEWWPTCAATLGDDISVMIERSPLDAREIMTLRSLGVSTITDLATTDVEALLPDYLPRVAHRTGAEQRLRLAARRGTMLVAGARLERLTTGPIDLPAADVEIDLDIETSAQNRVYLWGFLVHDRRTGAEPTYYPIASFSSLSDKTERALAGRAAQWLQDRVATAGSALVWHYSTNETRTLRHLAGPQPAPAALAWLSDYAATHFVDLLPIVRRNLFGVDGLGLKAVATAGPGFVWRDPEPGGLNSQYWFADAIRDPDPAARTAARERVLAYNEDDVRATWALRQWLRSLR